MPGFLDRSRCIAPLDYDRWRIPPAALAIHLSIGQAYAFSIFSLPLSRLIGVTDSAPGDWTPASISWLLPVAIVVLGLSAFTFGRRLEDAGPRKAMFTSASCFGGGLLVAALGVQLHQIAIVYLGFGVICGIGLGLGYIAPVTTLIRWFPDRPGMATGLAIAGFGGGALIGSPLAVALMERFSSASNTGVAMTLVVMGLASFAFMMFGVLTIRLPAPGWRPASYTAAQVAEPGSGPKAPPLGVRAGRSIGERKGPAPDVHVDEALKTRAFWLLWIVVCLSITAGIGVMGQASTMIQEIFPLTTTPSAAAGLAALLGLAHMAGGFILATSSDLMGRQSTNATCFGLGAALCALAATAGQTGNAALFVTAYVAITMLSGGALATIPAYVRDMFGVMHVGAIHGRLLTAWSLAVLAGPALGRYVRDYQAAGGAAKADVHAASMYAMAGLLVVGLVANWLVRPVESRHHFTQEAARA